ncbi:helix-turn-helix domain-containing protein [Ruegeria arenilitoris]|uniref:helix-turn-helix domain-containing protein n=1 Tax=Ruegeria arenilitoris TaxID=1173585 RepID=UPI0014807504
MKRVFTPKQLAERWDCSVQTVRDAISSGELPHFRVGRLTLSYGMKSMRRAQKRSDVVSA